MATRNVLEGVWKIEEVTTTAPNAYTHPGQPGIYIFTGNYYSITMVQGEGPRKGTALRLDATTEELREILRFSAQAGTYAVKGSEIILRPMVALRNRAMAGGAEVICSYALDGDTFVLSPTSNNFGIPILNQRLKLHRIE